MKEISGSTQTAIRTVIPTVAAATKATDRNIKKIKQYLSKQNNK